VCVFGGIGGGVDGGITVEAGIDWCGRCNSVWAEEDEEEEEFVAEQQMESEERARHASGRDGICFASPMSRMATKQSAKYMISDLGKVLSR